MTESYEIAGVSLSDLQNTNSANSAWFNLIVQNNCAWWLWARILDSDCQAYDMILPFSSYGTPGKLLNFSETWCPYLQSG